jgi:hypothetical protein
MTEHDRDQEPQEPVTGYAEEPRQRRRVTGLSDLLPDWLLSPEGKQHLRNARKEMMLAARTVLDAAIERQEAGPSPRRAVSRVEID